MAIISEVKCSRCDRRYSGMRSRCPYCGARRSKRGKFARGSENSKSSVIIAMLLMLIVVVAVVVLIVSSLKETDGTPGSPPPSESSSGVLPTEPSHSTVIDSPPPTGDASDEPPNTGMPTTAVQSVTILYLGHERTEFTMGKIGEKVPLTCEVIPEGIELAPNWRSSDPGVFAVVPDETGTKAMVTALGNGTAELTVTVGEVTATCTVIVRVT